VPNYRRFFVPGGTYFFTLVTHNRKPLFATAAHVQLFRNAVSEVKADQPFEIVAAVVLPDHVHFVWTLPTSDDDYSKRLGRVKARFTKRLYGDEPSSNYVRRREGVSPSRTKHRESAVWQRRFWEQTIDDEGEVARVLDYVHYNPVKHRLVRCPHQWEASSFHRWVEQGLHESMWGCSCRGRRVEIFDFSDIEHIVGE